MVDVGGGNIDGLEKLGHKVKAVSGRVKKLLTPGNLLLNTSVSDNVTEEVETNLL